MGWRCLSAMSVSTRYSRKLRGWWAGLLLGAATLLPAQTITQRKDYGAADFDPPAAASAASFSQTFSFTFDRFDPSLGLLSSVTVNYSFTFGGTVFTGPNAASGSFTVGGPITLDGVVKTGVGTGGGNGGPPNATQSLSGTVSGEAGTAGSNLITGESLTGLGQTTLAWEMSGSLSASNGSIVDLALTAGSFEVVYNYAPSAIPEPSTWAAIAGAAALVGATGARWWRHRFTTAKSGD